MTDAHDLLISSLAALLAHSPSARVHLGKHTLPFPSLSAFPLCAPSHPVPFGSLPPPQSPASTPAAPASARSSGARSRPGSHPGARRGRRSAGRARGERGDGTWTRSWPARRRLRSVTGGSCRASWDGPISGWPSWALVWRRGRRARVQIDFCSWERSVQPRENSSAASGSAVAHLAKRSISLPVWVDVQACRWSPACAQSIRFRTSSRSLRRR